ncbi:MAG: hypothetical protein HWD58_20005 [Bacteroidota bacterium]|nr:MAG: hypothetical protein HWD58_20005 [Bacteroidota bacterium]
MASSSSNKSPFDLLYLNKINLKANGGAGKVIERMQPIVQGEFISKTQMMACKHANGRDWWLLKMMHDSVSVYIFNYQRFRLQPWETKLSVSP